jgi:formyl-CoA transferase
MLIPVDQPGLGRVWQMNFPLKFSDIKPTVQRPAPMLAEHTDEVLQEFGFAKEEIQKLRAEGAVA